MDQTYRLRYSAPGERLAVGFTVMEGGRRRLTASMALRRHRPTRRALGRVATRPRRGPTGTSAGIYTNALRLWGKGATIHPNPRPSGPSCHSGHSGHSEPPDSGG